MCTQAVKEGCVTGMLEWYSTPIRALKTGLNIKNPAGKTVNRPDSLRNCPFSDGAAYSNAILVDHLFICPASI